MSLDYKDMHLNSTEPEEKSFTCTRYRFWRYGEFSLFENLSKMSKLDKSHSHIQINVERETVFVIKNGQII